MKTSLPPFRSLLALAAVALFLPGCATTTINDSATATARIAELQNRTEIAAAAFKKSHPATDETYVAVRGKYRDAAAKNRGFLAAVQAGVADRERSFDTPAYRDLAQGAGDAAKEFVDLAEKNTPADVRPMGSASVAVVAANVLVDAGLAIWKANLAAADAQAQAAASSLRQYEWRAWESL